MKTKTRLLCQGGSFESREQTADEGKGQNVSSVPEPQVSTLKKTWTRGGIWGWGSRRPSPSPSLK